MTMDVKELAVSLRSANLGQLVQQEQQQQQQHTHRYSHILTIVIAHEDDNFIRDVSVFHAVWLFLY